jgi:hypothetical protein
MRRRPLDAPTIEAVLLLGFGLTLCLWLLAGYDFPRRMSHVERESAAINAPRSRNESARDDSCPRLRREAAHTGAAGDARS